MADDFDGFLAAALAPPVRDPDRVFLARVQAQVALEERFAAERRSVVRELMQQLIGLLAVAAGGWWLGKAPPVASWAAESPATMLAILLVTFMFVAATFTMRTGAGNVTGWRT